MHLWRECRITSIPEFKQVFELPMNVWPAFIGHIIIYSVLVSCHVPTTKRVPVMLVYTYSQNHS